MRKFTFVCTALFFTALFSAQAQDEFEPDFPLDSLEEQLLAGIHDLRKAEELDSLVSHEILEKAAELQAEFMSHIEDATLEGEKGKYKNTGKRVEHFGGTKNAEEIVMKSPIKKGKTELTVKEIAETILYKWGKLKKTKNVIVNPKYVYASIATHLDQAEKKVFISVVFGSFDTFNNGAEERKSMEVPYTTKSNGIVKPEKANDCRRCDKWKDVNQLQQGLYVEEGRIYLKYDDIKYFRKLIRRKTDGLAVDVVQRKQYENPGYNIYDNSLLSKGVLLKKRKKNKLFRKNRAEENERGRVTSIDTYMGKLPKELKGEYEMNLLIIQNKKLCRTVTRSYLDVDDQEASNRFGMLYEPKSITARKPPFVPKAESALLNFVVPFEKNKYDYKPEDIEPILHALQEPDFIIDGMYIYAYSSIEGDSVKNAKLQQKRAESIINAMKEMKGQSNDDIMASVKTNDSWGLFQLTMEDHEQYGYLTQMPKHEAINTINTKPGLSDSLEMFLAEQRFAEVMMDITYDIEGKKEEKYSVVLFNRAVKDRDLTQAYKIQDYIHNKVLKGEYDKSVISLMKIPYKKPYGGLLNNQVVYDFKINKHKLKMVHWDELKHLQDKFPSNDEITFNKIYCDVMLDQLGNYNERMMQQKIIDALYERVLPKKSIDALNIEFQFKVMASMDTIDTKEAEETIQECINRIKGFYDFDKGSWQNALKVANAFIRFKDYDYAAQLLDGHVDKAKVDEQLLFTYITACAQTKDKMKTQSFVAAMRKVQELYPDRYCDLFGQPKLTFQVLDNPMVKDDFHSSTCE